MELLHSDQARSVVIFFGLLPQYQDSANPNLYFVYIHAAYIDLIAASHLFRINTHSPVPYFISL